MRSEAWRGYRTLPKRVLGPTLALAMVLGPTPMLGAQTPPRMEAAPRRAPTAVTLTDVQLKETGAGQYLVRIQADGPLAFDRVASNNPRQIQVRFYNVKVAQMLPWDAPQFGALSWSSDGRGNITLTVDLLNAYLQAGVAQAGHPNIAEIRVRS